VFALVGANMRAIVLALLVTTACHTTVRSRTTASGILEEEGSCVSDDIGPHERCHEREAFDESRTVLVVAAAIALIVAASAGIGYLDDHCQNC
jgi:hypothetical protein